MPEKYFSFNEARDISDFWRRQKFRLKARWDGASSVRDTLDSAKSTAFKRRLASHDEQCVTEVYRVQLEFYEKVSLLVTDATGWDDLAVLINEMSNALADTLRQVD